MSIFLNRRQFSVSGARLATAVAASSGGALLIANDAQASRDKATPSLAKALQPHFLFGSAITPGQILMGSPEFIKHHFNVVVAENAMKPEELARKGEGKYDFEAADDLVNFAVANKMKVRGHTLIWHQQMPAWFFIENGSDVSRATLIARMERYITDVVTHFKGRVYAWDVVNEAWQFNEGNARTDENGMRLSKFREIIGPEYLEIAFRAAAKADPNCQLFYNDYETQIPRKVAAICKWLGEMKSKDVKVDGIGHQAHYSVGYPTIGSFEAAILEFAKFGVTQHVTEMDIALNANITDNKVSAATPELLQKQAERYADFIKLFIKHKQHITAVLVWGINDGNTWLKYWPMRRFEAPLLFDEKGQPKPAFWSVIKAASAV